MILLPVSMAHDSVGHHQLKDDLDRSWYESRLAGMKDVSSFHSGLDECDPIASINVSLSCWLSSTRR